ncbi:MAG: hypothetical protein Q4A62_03340 [Eikenella sp.]|nr:hypothetical protein [Eikenella sp.]
MSRTKNTLPDAAEIDAVIAASKYQPPASESWQIALDGLKRQKTARKRGCFLDVVRTERILLCPISHLLAPLLNYINLCINVI